MCRSRIIIAIAFFFLFSCGTSHEESGENPIYVKADTVLAEEIPVDTNLLDRDFRVKIDSYVEKVSKNNNLSGAFLFAKDGKFYQNAFGKSRYLNGPDVGVNDVFQLASVSKFITAICILKLIEEGKLNLDDKVYTILPEFKYRRVTIHHLLTHSSGLPEYTYLTDRAWRNDTSTKFNKDFVEVLHSERAHPYFNAGRRFNYSNSNFALLAFIAQVKSNMSFPDVVEKYIKTPLGLDSLHVYEKEKKPLRSYSIWGMRGDHSFIPDHQQNNINGDKGVYANVNELFLIYKALKEDKLLNKESKNLLLTPHIRVKRKHAQYYCYGLRKISLTKKEKWFYHNGWWHGFRTYFWFSFDQDKCVVLLTNRLKGGFVNTKELVHLLDD